MHVRNGAPGSALRLLTLMRQPKADVTVLLIADWFHADVSDGYTRNNCHQIKIGTLEAHYSASTSSARWKAQTGVANGNAENVVNIERIAMHPLSFVKEHTQ